MKFIDGSVRLTPALDLRVGASASHPGRKSAHVAVSYSSSRVPGTRRAGAILADPSHSTTSNVRSPSTFPLIMISIRHRPNSQLKRCGGEQLEGHSIEEVRWQSSPTQLPNAPAFHLSDQTSRYWTS